MSKTMKKTYRLTEVSEIIGTDSSVVATFIQREWIIPVSVDEIDQEDIARIQLIQELQSGFGANDESIPLILHLMDQLYYLRHQMGKVRV
jgi:chaperone modulatory protein CbpM